VNTQSKAELQARRVELIAAVAALPPGEHGTPEWSQREEVLADLRNVNAAIKAANVTEAARIKAEGAAKRARGRAEQHANLVRAGVQKPEPVPAFAAKRGHQSLGEFLLWQATSLRKTLRRIKDPLPFTVEFLRAVNTFIDEQADHVRQVKAAEASGDPDDWKRTWADDQHHGNPDLACPACGTDSSVGCLATEASNG